MHPAGRPKIQPHIAAESERILRESADRARADQRQRLDRTLGRAADVAMGNVRVISDEESARREELQREQENGSKRRMLLEQAHVPERYAFAELTKINQLPDDAQEPWLAAAEKLMAVLESDSITILCGERGPGKTHLACGLIHRAINQLQSARYAKMTDYVNAIKECFGTGRSVASVEKEWTSPFLLVLDEEQERFGSVTEHVYVTRLIDLRYDAMRPTLLISNQSQEALEMSLGASIVSRATDGGGLIVCNWPSVRGRLRSGSKG